MKQTSLQDWYFEKIEESKNIFSIAEALILERGINLEKVYPKSREKSIDFGMKSYKSKEGV